MQRNQPDQQKVDALFEAIYKAQSITDDDTESKETRETLLDTIKSLLEEGAITNGFYQRDHYDDRYNITLPDNKTALSYATETCLVAAIIVPPEKPSIGLLTELQQNRDYVTGLESVKMSRFNVMLNIVKLLSEKTQDEKTLSDALTLAKTSTLVEDRNPFTFGRGWRAELNAAIQNRLNQIAVHELKAAEDQQIHIENAATLPGQKSEPKSQTPPPPPLNTQVNGGADNQLLEWPLPKNYEELTNANDPILKLELLQPENYKFIQENVFNVIKEHRERLDKDKNDPIAKTKESQLEKIDLNLRTILKNQLNTQPASSMLSVCDTLHKEIEKSANLKEINKERNVVGAILKGIAGVLLTIITAGSLLISNKFRKKFFKTTTAGALSNMDEKVKTKASSIQKTRRT